MDPLTIIAAATGAIKIAEDLYQFVAGARTTMQQSGEWTPEQETAFLQLQASRAKAAWQQPQG